MMGSKDTKQVIVVRRDLDMKKGKIAAQAAHASMKFLLVNHNGEDKINRKLTTAQQAWMNSGHAKVVVSVDSEQELVELVRQCRAAGLETHTITDAGRTEFKGVPTLTCAAVGPDYVDVIDRFTGGLRLL